MTHGMLPAGSQQQVIVDKFIPAAYNQDILIIASDSMADHHDISSLQQGIW